MVYLDYAAATPLSDAALLAMQPYFSEKFFNPSSPYAPAVEVRREYEAAKHTIAMLIGVRADDIVMTAGATESINLAMTAATDAHIVTTSIEHHAVLHAVERYDHTIVPVGRNGIVNVDEIRNAIQPSTHLVSVALANNEIGTIQPIREISRLVHDERQRRAEAGDTMPIWLHSDASQGVGHIDINVARLGVDMITINAAKCYGPKQVGLLWRTPEVMLKPLIVGGGQELGLRSGTENVAGTVGFAVALGESVEYRKAQAERLMKLRDQLQGELIDGCPDIALTVPTKKRLPGSLHVMIPGLDAERLVFLLETKQIYLATGSACAANSGSRSHVLKAIGLSDSEADGSLRMTLGRGTDESHIDRAAREIIAAISSEQKRMQK